MINLLEQLIRWLTRFKVYLEKREAYLGAARSPKWGKVRRDFLRVNPVCMVCGGDKDLDVHHLIPFSQNPALELEVSNLMTLCTPHHFLIGHLMSWRSWNSGAREDAAYLLNKVDTRP